MVLLLLSGTNKTIKYSKLEARHLLAYESIKGLYGFTGSE